MSESIDGMGNLMNIDFSLVPTTLDVAHVSLAAAAAVLFLLLLIVGFAGRSKGEAGPEVANSPAEEAVKETLLKDTTPESALQLLMLLQQDARLIDFVHEDLTGFSDSDVGAAARVVHEGSKKVLQQVFSFEAIRAEEEESRVTLDVGFNATENRLTGNVTGEAPFSGTLIHKGWKVTEVTLPQLAKEHDVMVVAPAEVEL